MVEPSTAGAEFAQALVHESSEALLALSGDGRVLFWNEGASALFGYPACEAVGRNVDDLIVPADKHGESRSVMAEVVDCGSLVLETVRRSKEGARLEVNVTMKAVRNGTGRIEYIAVAMADQTALRRTHMARSVDSNEDRFRRLLDAAPDAMVIADGEGRIVLANAQAEALFGYSRLELIGARAEMLIPERYRAAHPEHRAVYFGHPRARPMGAGGIALFGRRKDGSEFPAEISLSPFETEDGLLAITAIRDATERRRAEQERVKLTQAQEAIRLRDEFLSIASHELKTPLTAGLMQADALLHLGRRHGEALVPAALVNRLQTIHRAMQRLNTLINQLLDLSRITAGRLALERERVDLCVATRNVVALFFDELSRADCELVLRAESPVVGAWDAIRIEQIVTNLLSNAVKYGAGKPIEVTVTQSAEGMARLTVRDHGIGIAPDHQARIFERFERVVSERNYGGFGLGLWIVRQVIEAHGGAIRVWSEPGAGSTFTVDLPMFEMNAAARLSMAPMAPGDPKCVMVVDDDALIRSSLADALEDDGVQVVAAANGLEALKLLRSGAKPRLIFLDLMMPVMDAWAFLTERQKDAELAAIPVAILSAADNLDKLTINLGAVAHLRKPADVGSLLRVVERYCA